MAAAIAYGVKVNNDKKVTENVLVFRLGASSFDVSVMKINGKDIKVIATGGNSHLGGRDFDNCLVQNYVAEIERDQRIDIRQNEATLRRLRTACEQAKQRLSTNRFTYVKVDALCNENDFNAVITRGQFEEMCSGLFDSLKKMVDDVLAEAKKRGMTMGMLEISMQYLCLAAQYTFHALSNFCANVSNAKRQLSQTRKLLKGQ